MKKINISVLAVTSFLFVTGILQAQVTGSGTQYKLSKWTATGSNIGDSQITDNGTNVGIGNTSPGAKLSFIDLPNSSIADGITWYSPAPTTYGIFRTAGSWSSPNYQQLQLNWITGIILNPGASYTKSYVDIQGGGLRVSSGNVGIGTTTPSAKLHVNNGSVLFDGATGAIPTAAVGAGTRMLWYPAKSAFRAGAVTGTVWDDANIGTSSVAFGADTKAAGIASTAFGSSTTASAAMSTAFGGMTTASGGGSTAFGLGTSATAQSSSSFGEGTIASGHASAAFGLGSVSSGETSFAFGNGSTASGQYSAAFGTNTNAYSYGSFVVGKYNVVSGSQSSWVAADPLFVIGNGSGTGASSSNAVTVLKNGKTLIGNPALTGFMGTPDGYLLFVQQGILTEKVKVALDNTAYWSDYVFDKKYKLKSIEELESFVNTNKHLPNVPSAEEVVKEGIDMATMDAKLLEKIEEQSLYIIQLSKRIEALENNKK